MPSFQRVWSVLRKSLLLLGLVFIAAPLFYEPRSKDRIYPLRVVAAQAALGYRAANQAAGGPRNLTAVEHFTSMLLAPAVFMRARNTTFTNSSTQVLVLNAIPLMACGGRVPRGDCNPDVLPFWKGMEQKEVMIAASWAVVISAIMIPGSAWRRGAAMAFNLVLCVSLLVFGVICVFNQYQPTPQFFAALTCAGLEALQIQRMPSTGRSTLETLLAPLYPEPKQRAQGPPAPKQEGPPAPQQEGKKKKKKKES